ncbi:RNA-binding CRS1 domain [Olea europaea subsp. europaea]|uniref:RNA-binding CRS1 domain n=1 Tax=Olea europaea subsp. europaea TaxID=158383 RepID=A0A8S0UGJ6_OLEEU|nr:RNA-binding CRS1 domain [Olea europaea subsp. europaea]
MATLSSSSASHLRCRFILRPILPYFHFSLKIETKQSLILPLQTSSSFPIRNPAACPPISTRRLSFSSTPLLHELANDGIVFQNEQDEFDEDGKNVSKKDTVNISVKDGLTRVLDLSAQRIKSSSSKLPILAVKEKKELASYAHSLGKKLKSQQVGKSGVTDTVVTALIETLEANELLKLKIHSNCPMELDDAVKQLEEATGSVVVSQIGRTVILYRPSLTKLKEEEEKRRRAQKVFARKQQALNQSSQTTNGSGSSRTKTIWSWSAWK